MSTQLSFLDSQEFSQPEQFDISQQIFEDTLRQPYTKIPNRYIDKIRMRLTPAEDHVCMLILRKTYGWHRKCVYLKPSAFTKQMRAGVYKERVIFYAKKSLLSMGLLKRDKDNYYIDIFYDLRIELPEPEAPKTNYPQIPQEILSEIIGQELQLEANVENSVDNLVDKPAETPAEKSCTQCSETVDDSTVCEAPKLQSFAGFLRERGPQALDCTLKTNIPAEQEEIVCSLKNAIRESDPIRKEIFIRTIVKKFSSEEISKQLVIFEDYRKKYKIKIEMAFLMAALKSNYEENAKVSEKLRRDAAKAEFLNNMPLEERLFREKIKMLNIPESCFTMCNGMSDALLKEYSDYYNRQPSRWAR
jgi:hypothetical protein